MNLQEVMVSPKFERGTIYIIDDDEAMRSSIELALTLEDYACQTFSSPRLFLNHLPSISNDIVVLDMQMPEMSGLELQQILLDKKIHIPIIFVSGQSHPNQIIQSLKKGAIEFLLKPFSLNDLTTKIVDCFLDMEQQFEQTLVQQQTHHYFVTLSAREKEVMFYGIKGLKNKEIGQQLNLTEATIKLHKTNITRKMHTRSFQEVIALFYDHDLKQYF